LAKSIFGASFTASIVFLAFEFDLSIYLFACRSPRPHLPARSKKARSRYARQRAFEIRMCFCYLAAPDNAANTLCAW
jgi:hypothetical protein